MAGKTNFAVDKDNLEVKIEREFTASPERLWQAYTEPDQIVKWWSDTKVDKFELKVGGKWRFVGVGGDGKEFGFRGEFKELDPLKKIVRSFEYEPMAGHIMVESTMFEPVGDGLTKVTILSKFSNIDDLNGMVSMGMESGSSIGLDRLANLVES
ncbi:MAG TPA: SRPBCC domain-containing protein [Candidatus Binatia bacterium]|jgi:uncharacterized protein YndB with AHSA1/START domain|nr:SRPBCC domain-containing protein [Candidatus Binatia bacterium]